jgi:hypothetical protein
MNEHWEHNLLVGFAELFAASGFGTYTDQVTTAEPLITVMNIPAMPDQLITLAIYGQVSQNAAIAVGVVPLQVRVRSRPNQWFDCVDMAESIFSMLHGKEGLMIGDIHCPLITRASFAPLGQDTNQRWERAENYQIMVDLPSTENRE